MPETEKVERLGNDSGFIKKENIPFKVIFTKAKGDAIHYFEEAVLEGSER